MARFRSAKRAKQLNRKAKHAAKEVRKRERRESGDTAGPDDDIDWSQAVGVPASENPAAQEDGAEPAEEPATVDDEDQDKDQDDGQDPASSRSS